MKTSTVKLRRRETLFWLRFGLSPNEMRLTRKWQADQGDVIQFGIVPELVGRFPVLVPFHSFDKVLLFLTLRSSHSCQDMLIRVLSEPHNSLLAQMKLLFGIDNVRLYLR